MPPGSTEAPTGAPTSPYVPGNLESPVSGTSTDAYNGLQFDVTNLGDTDVIVNKFSVLFASSGTQHIEVWYREGSEVSLRGPTGTMGSFLEEASQLNCGAETR